MGKPRRINVVSVSIGILLVAGIYFGWKLVPPYLDANKVDTELGSQERAG